MICSECGWKHREDTDGTDWSKPVLGKCQWCGEIRAVFGPRVDDLDAIHEHVKKLLPDENKPGRRRRIVSGPRW